jgi:hypothetical protein
MDTQLPPDLVLVDHCLGLMRELENALRKTGAAIVAADLRDMERQSARQREICAAIGELHEHMRKGVASSGETREVSRYREEEWRAALNRVWNLNRVQAGLVRRGRRTVDIFCRVLASSAATYTPPAPAATWKK